MLRGTLKEIYFPLTRLSDAVSSNAVWENRALAGASEPRSDFGVDEILCLLASSSGRVPPKVTGHARSHLDGPSSRACEHPSNQHPSATLQLVKHTHVTRSEHPEICKITTLVPRVDYRAGRKLLSVNSGLKDTARSRG